MAAEVSLCCGRQPLEQRSHGRRVLFCIGCGKEYDAGAATVRERMHDEVHRIIEAGGEVEEPCPRMKGYVEVRRIRGLVLF